MARHFDLAVIGSGPAGQKGAINAAKMGKKVAIVDREVMLGGACTHTGTIPSKTLREAVLYLSGFRQRAFYGRSYTLQEQITWADLSVRVHEVVSREQEIVRDQLLRNHIRLISGVARFLDEHTLLVESSEGSEQITADFIMIATGTRPAHAPSVPTDGQRIMDSDQMVLESHGRSPVGNSSIVVGAGVIGLEYASMATALKSEVTIVDAREDILEFVDHEILESLCFHLRSRKAKFRLGEKVTSVEIDSKDRVSALLESGKRVTGDTLLYTVGRDANTDSLGLGLLGIETDARGRIPVDAAYRTAQPHIYAAGDVIGFPALASTSMEQGRLAAAHMFAGHEPGKPPLLPYGIYTIPEVSMIGKTEQELTHEKVPYEVGSARFDELARGNMIGDSSGMLKLLFHAETLEILGVHILGDGACELIHIGQAAMTLGGTMEFLRDTVFNYPTLAEAYKVAALDGLNRL
ncbi:MAG: Si-specific NAD(P)(+) transhydrogenase [Candidatus Binatia bacterium]|nr:Si-specific NAD(P)(+) transhydrogenase [Candidatus Binatia bacterium]MDG2009122.1 Si-specific NAD(P)(+) transhydrogenase [Candidatus Binatia bacterium]HAC81799.1 Si-specific NAD(P)(+) transhydrogenase [Deltaproteobacteria bacterium]